MNQNNMQDINPTLKKLISVIPIFQDIFPFDSRPAVTDVEKFIVVFPSKQEQMDDTTDPASFVGKRLEKGDGLYEAIHEKKMISNVIPKEVFGTPLRNISMPIYDENNKEILVGALGFAFSVETQFTLQETSQILSSSAEELNAVAEEFSGTAESLADKMNTLSNSSNAMIHNLEKTDDILIFIDDLADRTKLLGLNALIEAARAGEYGRSFSVVANEIQKMSENSAKSVNEIKDLLKNIQKEVKLVNSLIIETRELSSQQSLASVEISKSIESLSKIAETINMVAMKL